jgi:outer membrane protein assembly factor BamB
MHNRFFPSLCSRFTSAPLSALIAWCLAVTAMAQDWPQWGRTNARNMYSPEKGLPDQVDAGQFKRGTDQIDLATAKNLKWVGKLGTQSYGNVTVANGRVLVGTNNYHTRDPQHKGDRSILKCFDEETGEFLWQLVVPKLRSGKVNDWDELGLLSSAKVEGDRVYIVTSRCEVMCLDLNGMANGNTGPFTDEASYVVLDTGNPPATIGPKDADIIWVYDMMDELGVFPHNASNSSPLIVGDYVYVCTSNGQDWTHVNIPAPLSPSFIAVHKETGELAGEDDANIGPRIFHGQWSSPSSGVVNGKELVFFGGGDGWLYAFDSNPVEDDEAAWLKTVWRYDANPPEYRTRDGEPIRYPRSDGPSEINATPTFYKDRVYVAIGQDPEHGEGVGHLVCVDATQTGDVTQTATVWSYKGIHRSISTVSIDPETNLLFVGDFSGFVHCLDADTGELHWTHDMKAHMWGSTLVADGKVYVGDEDGDLLILAATKEKKILSETNLNSPIYGTPIVANGVLYVQTNSHLFAFHDGLPTHTSTDQPKPNVNIELGR